ncbi:hypothetical protein H0Z60_11380 [Ectothiorhodospiraceae bacterium WFHF3C12]|nr:hypothetical protein [Ectothiorhodospiraceae bacterium WFHF3C12]
MGEVEAYLSLETGKVHLQLEPGAVDDMEPLPDDIDDADKYVAIPDKYHLDLGKDLVFRFVSDYVPEDVGTVRGMFSRKGAYRRFKDFLEDRGLLDQWYAYEEAAIERALREWCEYQGVALSDE